MDLSAAGRDQLIAEHNELEALEDELLRRQILENNRIDLLMTEVLDYRCEHHHRKMLKFTLKHRRKSMCLVWRGAGKTYSRTYAYAIWHILKNPNVRILIASRSGENAADMASTIRKQFESNEKLRRIFGDMRGKDDWCDSSFTVSTRTRVAKESTIETVGVEGAVVSRHYDVILGDDLVDQKTVGTARTRENTLTFYAKSLIPTLEPDTGEIHLTGTRYHPRDLYGVKYDGEIEGTPGEYRDCTLVLPALTGDDMIGYRSGWPEKFSVPSLIDLRDNVVGRVHFETQFQCSCTLMAGKIFSFEQFESSSSALIPQGLPAYLGGDLAASLERDSDYFALITIYYDRSADTAYVMAPRRARQVPIHIQRKTFASEYDAISASNSACESNFFQSTIAQDIRREYPHVNIVDFHQAQSKETKAWDMVALVDAKKLVFTEGCEALLAEMVALPDGENDDMFDALYAALYAARKRAKKPREERGLNFKRRTST